MDQNDNSTACSRFALMQKFYFNSFIFLTQLFVVVAEAVALIRAMQVNNASFSVTAHAADWNDVTIATPPADDTPGQTPRSPTHRSPSHLSCQVADETLQPKIAKSPFRFIQWGAPSSPTVVRSAQPITTITSSTNNGVVIVTKLQERIAWRYRSFCSIKNFFVQSEIHYLKKAA